MDKISVLNFIKDSKKAADIDKYMKQRIVVDYIPFEEKIARAQRVINATSYRTLDVDGKERKEFAPSSPSRYMFFILEVISAYTDISIDFKNAPECFNMLNKEALTDMIINYIPEREYNEFGTVFDMVFNDLLDEERSVTSFIENRLFATGKLFEGLSPVLDKLLANNKVVDAIARTLDKVK